MKIYLTIFLLSFISCNTNHEIKQNKGNESSLIVNQSMTEYLIFNNKLKILSTEKPLEEDAKNSISSIALTVYNDLKKYTFYNVIKKGAINLSISELKEMDSSLSAREQLTELVNVNENQNAFAIKFDSLKKLNNNSLSGYWTKGKAFTKEKESSFMYLGVLTDKKILIIVIAVYEMESDFSIIQKTISSIEKLD